MKSSELKKRMDEIDSEGKVETEVVSVRIKLKKLKDALVREKLFDLEKTDPSFRLPRTATQD